MQKVEIRISLSLKFYNEYFTGGGKGTGHVQGYLLRDALGFPYIPASLLKGNVSHNARMISSFFPKADASLLFGGAGVKKGILYFDDAVWKGTGNPYQFTDYRTSVTISRYTKTNQQGLLHTIETAGDGGGMIFAGAIQGFLPNYEENTALLVTSLQLLYALGGSRSRGLG